MSLRAAAQPHNTPAAPLQAVAPEKRSWWSLREYGRRIWTVHLVLLAIFAILAVIAHSLRADRLDVWITDQIQRLTVFDGPLQLVSWFGYTPQEIVILGAIIALIFAVGYRVESLFLLISVVGSNLIGALVKNLVARPRPGAPAVHVLRHLGGYSFPSGHVLTYISFFGFLAYLAWVEPRNSLVRGIVLVPCLALLILIGPSRIYVGAHWASDVIGAYLLGVVWLSVILRLYVAWLARGAPEAPSRGGS
ncbi:MAG TPA: phosphatase PAP2 family protein [Chloroflexota bacterium]|nr:phosphatase PAP2 family protein [Chloroflexota bacterium]